MRVLVADDDSGVIVALALCHAGLHAVAVASAGDLDAALRCATVDAVVLDLRLPDASDPDELVALVRLRHHGRLVIASGDDRALAVAGRAGVACVVKPYSVEALVAAIKGEWP